MALFLKFSIKIIRNIFIYYYKYTLNGEKSQYKNFAARTECAYAYDNCDLVWYSLGETPTFFLKTLEKYKGSEKPLS